MSVVRVPACPVDFCPFPSEPDFHECFCGSRAVEHHHVISRGMGGSKKRRNDPANVVCICHAHHEAVTLHRATIYIENLPWKERGLVYLDEKGNETGRRMLPSCDGAEPTDVDGPQVQQGSALSQATGGDDPKASPLVGTDGRSSSPVGGEEGQSQPPTDLLVPRRMSSSPLSFDDWSEQGRCLRDEGLHLRKLTTEWAFRVGEWWNHGERVWPHESSQMMDELGLSYWQITKFASIAARVPPENRLSRDKDEMLTLEHYRAVANLPPESQPEALGIAIDEGMSASGLKLWLAERDGATGIVAPETCICPNCGKEHRKA